MTTLSNLNFQRASSLAHVHDLPIKFMTREFAKSICDTVGTVCCFIGGVDEDGGRFMCVKVNLDISLPLC